MTVKLKTKISTNCFYPR